MNAEWGTTSSTNSSHAEVLQKRMDISEATRERAIQIKNAVEATPELDNLSDMWYAQYATVMEGEDMEKIIDRALRLQAAREEYKIVDSFEFACKSLREGLDEFPAYVFACCFIERDGCYVLMMDTTKFDNEKFDKNPEIWMRAFYFLAHATCCDLEAIRNGAVVVFECDGFDWRKHINLKNVKTILDEHGMYPVQYHSIKSFHNGVFWNLLYSLVRKSSPTWITGKLQLGCKFDGGRLDKVYNTPTQEEAQERLWARLVYCLRLRYDNERAFSLGEEQKEAARVPYT